MRHNRMMGSRPRPKFAAGADGNAKPDYWGLENPVIAWLVATVICWLLDFIPDGITITLVVILIVYSNFVQHGGACFVSTLTCEEARDGQEIT